MGVAAGQDVCIASAAAALQPCRALVKELRMLQHLSAGVCVLQAMSVIGWLNALLCGTAHNFELCCCVAVLLWLKLPRRCIA